MDEERWQESLNARNTLAANQAIYAAWSAAWTAEATDNTINIYKHFTSRGQRCPYTLQIVEAPGRWLNGHNGHFLGQPTRPWVGTPRGVTQVRWAYPTDFWRTWTTCPPPARFDRMRFR